MSKTMQGNGVNGLASIGFVGVGEGGLRGAVMSLGKDLLGELVIEGSGS